VLGWEKFVLGFSTIATQPIVRWYVICQSCCMHVNLSMQGDQKQSHNQCVQYIAMRRYRATNAMGQSIAFFVCRQISLFGSNCICMRRASPSPSVQKLCGPSWSSWQPRGCIGMEQLFRCQDACVSDRIVWA
jgi:hypothetical protein